MKSKTKMVTFVVSKVESGQPLQVFLATKLKISRRAAKKMLDERVVWVNRRSIWMAHHALRVGDTVEVTAGSLVEKGAVVTTPKIKIIFEDDNYLIIEKGAGLFSNGADSVEALLREQMSNQELVVVHRLDRDTTGCLLVAKSQEALEAAIAVFKTRRVLKIYHAIVYGKFARAASTIKQELEGERAVTHVQREVVGADATFLKIKIETGRTHQIRRHLAQQRHPVLGDRDYGVKFAHDPRLLSIPRQMLHATGLELPHPLQPNEVLKGHSPLPADFRRCLDLFDLGKKRRAR